MRPLFEHSINELTWKVKNAQRQSNSYSKKLEKLKAFDVAYPHKFHMGTLTSLDGWKEWAKYNLGAKGKRCAIKDGFICFAEENYAFAFKIRWT